jgi:hypothetical protein
MRRIAFSVGLLGLLGGGLGLFMFWPRPPEDLFLALVET